MTVATQSVPVVLSLSTPTATTAACTLASLPASPIVNMPESLLQDQAQAQEDPTNNVVDIIKQLALEDCEQTQTTSPTTLEYEEEDELQSHASSFRLSMPEGEEEDTPACCESESSSSSSDEDEVASSPQQEATTTTTLNNAVEDPSSSEFFNHPTLLPTGATPPVIKPYDLASVPVHSKQRWMSLKMPPNVKMQSTRLTRSVSAPTSSPADTSSAQQRHRVSFCAVHVREYQPTMGDNPSCSYGPPISLDWAYDEREPVAVDDYETSRPRRRTLRQMMLNYYHRTHVLKFACGYTDAELEKASRAAERCKSQRAITKALLGVSKLEEVWQSTKRKTARLVTSKKSAAVDGVPV